MYSNNRIEFCVRSDLRPYQPVRPKSNNALPPLQSIRILDQIRERIRYLHYSRSTEDAYVYWCRYFIRWSGKRHPREMGKAEVEAFLTFLVGRRNVSISTHRVALSSLLFLYQKVLGIDLPWLEGLLRPVPRKHLPVVLSPEEVGGILARLTSHYALLDRQWIEHSYCLPVT